VAASVTRRSANSFPDGDLVAQWVFLVSALAEDLRVTIGRNAEVRDDAGFRLMSYLHRQTIVRLYEARRLVVAVDTHDELREFAEPLLGQFELDLRDYYLRRERSQSVVEELWEEVRHRSERDRSPRPQQDQAVRARARVGRSVSLDRAGNRNEGKAASSAAGRWP
jgi:hypothetical protein